MEPSLLSQTKQSKTTGLDPRTRIELWDFLRELVAEGATVLLTTQYLEEADELADEISVIERGRVIAEGTADELKQKMGGDRLVAVPEDRNEVGTVAEIISSVTGSEAPVIETGSVSATVTPQVIVFSTIQPLMFVFLFNFVFGGSIDTGMSYINYLIPGVLVQTSLFAGSNTAIGLAQDLESGAIDRFRSLPMRRSKTCRPGSKPLRLANQ